MSHEKEKGNGRTAERRTGVDRRIEGGGAYSGPERRKGGDRRRADRSPDKPVKR
jgi:hypothetical protein